MSAAGATRLALLCHARGLVCSSPRAVVLQAARLTVLPARPASFALRASSTDGVASAPPGGRSAGSASPERSAAQALVDTLPVRGTRDFPPEDMRLRNWLFNHFREVSLLFGFEEWDAPVLESEALYTRKAGEEITQQLYNFEDKGGRRLALRPELTPSLARIVLAKGKGLALPAKWFALAQCWRYERMTRGRRREHYQWNMDVVGVSGVSAEAELLAALTTFLSRVGLTPQDVGVRVSSRKVLAALLQRAGVPEAAFAPVCVVVDKIDKVSQDTVLADLAQLGLSDETSQALLSAMALRSLDDLAALLGEDAEAVQDLRQLWALAEAYDIAPWLTFDATVVRGLSYYTGVVFEAFDRAGTLRAICGGGRYDKLLSAYGGQDMPCAGFGFGDAVIVELLQEKGLLPNAEALSSSDDVVAILDEEARPAAVRLASVLRACGRRVDLLIEPPRKSKTLAKRAQLVGASRLMLLEGRGDTVRVKTLQSREELDVSLTELLESLK